MDNIEKKIKSIIAEQCDVDIDSLQNDTEFARDLGITQSIVYLQLCLALEGEFDLEFKFVKLKNCKTIGAAIEYVKQRIDE